MRNPNKPRIQGCTAQEHSRRQWTHKIPTCYNTSYLGTIGRVVAHTGPAWAEERKVAAAAKVVVKKAVVVKVAAEEKVKAVVERAAEEKVEAVVERVAVEKVVVVVERAAAVMAAVVEERVVVEKAGKVHPSKYRIEKGNIRGGSNTGKRCHRSPRRYSTSCRGRSHGSRRMNTETPVEDEMGRRRCWKDEIWWLVMCLWSEGKTRTRRGLK